MINRMAVPTEKPLRLGLLTGGDDRSYALGLTSALATDSVFVEFVGSDKLDAPELHTSPHIEFLNLRGDQRENVGKGQKVVRILKYYWRLIKYAATTRAPILHILWNNKLEFIDRVGLMLYYRLLGKKVVFTAHNVNAGKRDGRDSWLNQFTLSVQYRLCHHIFVHTEKMRQELLADFGVPESQTSVIPFGINNTSVTTALTPAEARARLSLAPEAKVLLFFGQIAPYKGLEYLLFALSGNPHKYRLLVAGKVKQGCEAYWAGIEQQIATHKLQSQLQLHIRHIPDAEVEVFFKAADAVALPYVNIFQSGVPFLAYSFGLPVIAADVGSLKADIVEGKTGFIFQPCDPIDLSRALAAFYASDLYAELPRRRAAIRDYANEQHSWAKVSRITTTVYQQLLAASADVNKTNN